MRDLMVSLGSSSELMALHRALMEAKFNPTVRDELIKTSPFVVSIMKQVVELLIEVEGDDWIKWRNNPSEYVVLPALKVFVNSKAYISANETKKAGLIKDFFAPYTPSLELQNSLILATKT